MKRTFAFIILSLLALGALSGCSAAGSGPSNGGASEGRLSIVATIFPEYDWLMNVLGSNPAGAEVTLLLGAGVDMHSFQPSAADMLKISSCDLFIYVGGESDSWVKDALREAVNKSMVTVNLLETLGSSAKEEEAAEGMQGEECEDEEETEYDEHVWLSLKNAALLTESISRAMQKLDPANAEVYRSNTAAYLEKLSALDAEYAAAVSAASVKTLLFGDRFPFRYLTDDYGLAYYAAFAGCSAETEASFETITFLAQKADELSLHAILTIDGSDRRIAETIVSNTRTKDQKILTLDSMQSTAERDVRNGTTYLSIMEKNLAVLREALV